MVQLNAECHVTQYISKFFLLLTISKNMENSDIILNFFLRLEVSWNMKQQMVVILSSITIAFMVVPLSTLCWAIWSKNNFLYF